MKHFPQSWQIVQWSTVYMSIQFTTVTIKEGIRDWPYGNTSKPVFFTSNCLELDKKKLIKKRWHFPTGHFWNVDLWNNSDLNWFVAMRFHSPTEKTLRTLRFCQLQVVAMPSVPCERNIGYLKTKKERSEFPTNQRTKQQGLKEKKHCAILFVTCFDICPFFVTCTWETYIYIYVDNTTCIFFLVYAASTRLFVFHRQVLHTDAR